MYSIKSFPHLFYTYLKTQTIVIYLFIKFVHIVVKHTFFNRGMKYVSFKEEERERKKDIKWRSVCISF